MVENLEDLKNKYISLNDNYKNLEKLLEAYNPWTDENISKLSEDFFAALENEDNEFSWLKIDSYDKKKDKEKKDLHEELKDKERAASIDYGIPSHVRGDIENGTLFLCLVNPNIQYDGSKNKGITSFYEEARKLGFDDQSLKILDKNGDDIKNYIFDSRSEGGILYKELDENGIEKPGYYTDKYLNGLLKIINDSENVENNENSIYYKEISKKIVNLEAFPFRSSSPNFARKTTKDYENRFANCLVKSTSKVIMLSARIILWKILDYINSDEKYKVQPVFIFRRFNQAWKPSITNVLKEDFNVGEDRIETIFNELHNKYFYTLRHLDNDNFSEITKNEIYKNNKKISTNVAKYDEFKTLIIDALGLQKDNNGN